MPLQQQIVNKIEDFGGIESIVEFLNRFRLTVKDEDKVYFNNVIDYFSLLCQQKVPVESHAVEYREASLKTIEVFNYYNKKENSETLTFLSDLITFKLEAVSNIKGLAS
tara:strand:+ start:4226 stop:4552 length:327 start_codon:yes stop_codon:yes gene_type:complete